MREKDFTGLLLVALFVIGALFAALPVMAQAAPTVSISVTTGNVPKIDWACQAPATAATATSVPADPAWSGTLPSLTGSKTATAITDTRAYTVGCVTSLKDYFDLTITNPTKNTDGSTLTDLAAFEIYRGTSASNLVLVKTIPASTSATTPYRDTGLAPGTYYYQVVSVTTASLRSAGSAVGNGTASASQTASASATLKVPAAPPLTVN